MVVWPSGNPGYRIYGRGSGRPAHLFGRRSPGALAMSRQYRHTPAGAGQAPPGPRPVGMGAPQPGIQVVHARAPRVGPSAAELDGVTLPPPLVLGERAGKVSDPQDYVAASPPGRLNGVPETFDDDRCVCCGGEGAALVTVGRAVLCDACVMTAVDAVRAEMPRRRLMLAMERLAAGTVSIETVEAVERLVSGQTDRKTDV